MKVELKQYDAADYFLWQQTRTLNFGWKGGVVIGDCSQSKRAADVHSACLSQHSCCITGSQKIKKVKELLVFRGGQ